MLPHPADWTSETAVSSGWFLAGPFLGLVRGLKLPSGCVLTWPCVWRAQGWGSVSPLFSLGT